MSVPRVDKIEPKRFFEEFYAANRPVILTGLVDHWVALEKWTLDYLDATVGDAVVELSSAEHDTELLAPAGTVVLKGCRVEVRAA